MRRKSYEIWRHEESQSWKVFTSLTADSRLLLETTGWNSVIQYQEGEADDQGACPEEVLLQISRSDGMQPKIIK